MEGKLLVDKPVDWTSFDVVNYVRRKVATFEDKKPKNIKVGHTGTLDPFATGLLVLLIGKKYTKQAGILSKQDKTYAVTMLLGQTSSTGDPEGEKKVVSLVKPSGDEVLGALSKQVGENMQTPPQYSAIKINGQRAYSLAREGKTVTLMPRKITIYELTLIEYTYPFIRFTVRVSSGTYIRSLVETIGEALHTGAYTEALRRTQIGELNVDSALPVSVIESDSITTHLLH